MKNKRNIKPKDETAASAAAAEPVGIRKDGNNKKCRLNRLTSK